MLRRASISLIALFASGTSMAADIDLVCRGTNVPEDQPERLIDGPTSEFRASAYFSESRLFVVLSEGRNRPRSFDLRIEHTDSTEIIAATNEVGVAKPSMPKASVYISRTDGDVTAIFNDGPKLNILNARCAKLEPKF